LAICMACFVVEHDWVWGWSESAVALGCSNQCIAKARIAFAFDLS
jgi:hypothetical protein